MRSSILGLVLAAVHLAGAVSVPASPPSGAKAVDKSLVSVSFEFFTFPEYTTIPATSTCLANIQALRGAPPAVRIGGTTQCVPHIFCVKDDS